MTTPIAKLSVAKRKREDAPNDATGSTPLATSLLVSTPRLRSGPLSLSSHSHSPATMTPLLTMPAPSPELMPVLTARAARAASDANTSVGLMRSSSAVQASTSGSPTAAATFAAQLRSAEAAASERERALRITVEELRAAIRTKTNDVAEAHIKAEQRELQIEQQRIEFQQQIEKLNTRLRFIHGEERKTAELSKSNEDDLRAAQDAHRAARVEIGKLKQQLVFATSPVHKPTKVKPADTDEVTHLENMVSLQGQNITELESEIDTMTSRLDEAESDRLKIEELEARLSHAHEKLKDAESRIATYAADVETAEVTGKRAAEFLATQARADALQAENDRLREQRHNTALAAEQLLTVQSKLNRMENDREAAALVAVENEQLRAQLHDWESSITKLGIPSYAADVDADVSMVDSPVGPSSKRRRRVITPQPFIDSYHQLQSTNLALQARVNQAELHAKTDANEKTNMQERIDALTAQLAQHEQTISHNKTDLLNLQRQTTLLQKEKDGLQKVLDAYDDEQTPLAPKSGGASIQIDTDPDSADQHRALKARVTYLETIVRELEKQVKTYQRELGVKPPVNTIDPAEPIPSVVALLSQIVNLEKQLSHLESITTDLTEKVEWVNQQYPHLLDKEHGNFKVIQLASNPSHARLQSKYKAELDECQKANAILKLQVSELQQSQSSGGAPVDSGVASGSALLALESSFQSRIAALENEKSQLEKKTQRLKEIFGQKVLEFRNTCYLLTGYKIELIHGSSYRLKNMYAEKESDQLMFQQQASVTAADGSTTPGGLSVLETEFTKSLDGSITTYLDKFGSIPGFLAAVTLQLLENQTKVR